MKLRLVKALALGEGIFRGGVENCTPFNQNPNFHVIAGHVFCPDTWPRERQKLHPSQSKHNFCMSSLGLFSALTPGLGNIRNSMDSVDVIWFQWINHHVPKTCNFFCCSPAQKLPASNQFPDWLRTGSRLSGLVKGKNQLGKNESRKKLFLFFFSGLVPDCPDWCQTVPDWRSDWKARSISLVFFVVAFFCSGLVSGLVTSLENRGTVWKPDFRTIRTGNRKGTIW